MDFYLSAHCAACNELRYGTVHAWLRCEPGFACLMLFIGKDLKSITPQCGKNPLILLNKCPAFLDFLHICSLLNKKEIIRFLF